MIKVRIHLFKCRITQHAAVIPLIRKHCLDIRVVHSHSSVGFTVGNSRAGNWHLKASGYFSRTRMSVFAVLGVSDLTAV